MVMTLVEGALVGLGAMGFEDLEDGDWEALRGGCGGTGDGADEL